MRALMPLFLAALALPASAQVIPRLDERNPRLQSVHWRPDTHVILTALPQTGLTVLLEPGEQIQRVTLGDNTSYDVRISSEGDSFLVLPRAGAGQAMLEVATDRRSYDFALRTEMSLTAAYLVRFDFGADQPRQAAEEYYPGNELWPYRLRGDDEVRPAAIGDDGTKTWIEFAPDQALPAIFAIGPGGDEQVVNGYMRGERFVIDRVHEQLIFRIDRKKATASRADHPEGQS